jgi:hypothetical protein
MSALGLMLWACLPADRAGQGVVWAAGQGRVLALGRAYGLADHQMAAVHHNAVEDPTQAFGEHPAGIYRVTGVVASTPEHVDSYGPDFLVLEPVGGEALTAQANGRTGIGIHGGRPREDGSLRPTYGCLRVENAWMVVTAAEVRAALDAGVEVFYTCLLTSVEAPR